MKEPTRPVEQIPTDRESIVHHPETPTPSAPEPVVQVPPVKQ